MSRPRTATAFVPAAPAGPAAPAAPIAPVSRPIQITPAAPAPFAPPDEERRRQPRDTLRVLASGLCVLTRRETIATAKPLEFIDVTDRVVACVADAGIEDGSVVVYSRHTTVGIRINEHEPLLLEDMAQLLATVVPEGAYRHDDMSVRTVNLNDDERVNGHSHCRSLLLGASETIPVAGGRLMLGRWQRIFLVELDGPNQREIVIQATGC